MKIGVYPGSFDPFTIGHLDVLKSAASLFDIVYVAVLNNSGKHPAFTAEERKAMIDRVIETEQLSNVRSGMFDGLLVDYAASVGAEHIIRGLRAITDFEYEFQIDAVNRHLSGDIRTVYFMASPSHSFLSSSNVKEIGRYGRSVAGLVPSCNEDFIRERLARQ
ncbi:MAG: pantetheine-phosphate adenylyltransferase [Clostridia bacterium]|nr:pantetheine-phosphate adenylyltransferase [Clostridia bacterium]MBQ9188112.1 pantetheine-phosphate adenylyltransferase [Clostridia bacterium]MBR3270381.1 pantetheine-phosphate adenylyltransferase [Clostridia bacterium]